MSQDQRRDTPAADRPPPAMDDEKSALAGRRCGEVRCPRCGAVFVCGNAAGEERCWCAELPPVLPVPGAGGACFCPACLRGIVGSLGRADGQ